MTQYLNPWVIGGDGRYKWAVKCMRDGGIPVKTWGVPGEKNEADHLVDALLGANLVLLSMNPFDRDLLTVGGESVEAGLLPKILGDNPVLVAGSFPTDLEAWLQDQGVKCVSLLDQEDYLLKNAAVTAEGAVYLALEAMDRTMFGAKVLIIGWGRIGKFLAQKLGALGAKVTVAVRKTAQRAELELLGYSIVETGKYENGLEGYDLIINTVPKKIMSLEQFARVDQECVVVELASLPGGFPPEQRGRIIMGQALPGKTAPKTAGENLTAALLCCLTGEGRTLE